MEYKLIKQIRDNNSLRRSYSNLAVETFDLSFENWYESGYWTDCHIPYVLAAGNHVAANVSVNVFDFAWKGNKRRYIQLGTVMTDAAYRNQGLCRRLMEEVLNDFREKSDLIYLYANDTVLDFYPKFGFRIEKEYQYKVSVSCKKGDFVKLDMEKKESRTLLKRCYDKSNPFSELFMMDNFGLILFYCIGFMKDSVYYSQKYDAVCIAMQDENGLTCFDIFCDDSVSFDVILAELAAEGETGILLGFTPKRMERCSASQINEENNTLFILEGKENIFTEAHVMFPLLSHT